MQMTYVLSKTIRSPNCAVLIFKKWRDCDDEGRDEKRVEIGVESRVVMRVEMWRG